MKLYAVKDYTKTTWNNETGKTNVEYVKGSIQELAEFIENNNEGLHERLDTSKECIFFGDLDHYSDKDLFYEFLDVLSDRLDVPINDIKYTISKKDNEYSYHWTVPTIKTNMYTIKKVLSEEDFEKFKCDTSVYCNRWFRLPNQTNENKPLKHKISCGDYEDFIIHNTKKTNQDFFIKEEQPKKESKSKIPAGAVEQIIEEMKKLLQLLTNDYYNDFELWRNVGFVINNELGDDGYELFDEFSKQSKKYNKSEVFKFYSNIKKKDSGLKIGSLYKWAKECNPEEYDKLFPKKEKRENNYKLIKLDFETKNFKLRNPVGFAELSKYDGLVIRSKKDLKDVYQNIQLEEQFTDNNGNVRTTKKSFIKEWLDDNTARTYEKVDFKPCQEVEEDVYNLFSGFEVTKKELYNIDVTKTKVYEHLFNLCGREEPVLNYVLNCLSNIVQKPYDLTKTSLIFRSVQGCGKDTFFNWFGQKILGSQYYMNDSKTELIFGRFNSMISKKLLIVINEVNQNETNKIIDNIKDAITKDRNKIEIKGKEPREEQNNIFYVYLTNSENPLPIEQTDRRFVAIECNKEIARDQEYFTALYDELESGNIDKAFYEFLLKRNINNFNFDKQRPQTQLYKTIKERNIPVLAKFLCEVVDNKNQFYGGTEFYEHFQAWLYNNGYKDYKYTNTKFGIDLKSYPGIEKGKNQKGNVEYKISHQLLKDYLLKNDYYEVLPEFID